METTDRRAYELRMLRSIGCTELSLYLYPRIVPIHNLSPEDGFANEQGQLQVPPTIRASFSKIEEGGVYLDASTSSLPVLETHLNAQVRNLLQYLSTLRGSKAVTLQLARQGLDGAEYEFARLLLEDRNNEAQSYVDWLVHIHRQINLELAGHRKKDDANSSGESTLATLANLKPPYW
jgi:protein transport protein SEC24